MIAKTVLDISVPLSHVNKKVSLYCHPKSLDYADYMHAPIQLDFIRQ